MNALLQRYTIGSVLKSLLVTWLVLNGVVITLILGDTVDDLWEHNATFQQTVTYIVCALPQKTFVILPAICLMGSLFGILALSRHNELSAMFASGASLRWLLLPMMFVSAAIGGGAYYWNEYVGAPLSKYGEQMMMTEIKKTKGVFKDYGLLKGAKNRFIKYGDFDRSSQVLTDVILHELDPERGGHRLFVRADRASWDPTRINPETGKEGVWLLEAVSPDSENYKILLREDWSTEILPIGDREILQIEERPEDFGLFERHPIEMSRAELAERIRSLEADGTSPESLYADLEFKRAVPFSIIALMIIGMASGASSFLLGQEGAARFTYPLGLCLVILAVFYTLTLAFRALGTIGLVSPFISAWVPIAVMAGVGTWMLGRN